MKTRAAGATGTGTKAPPQACACPGGQALIFPRPGDGAVVDASGRVHATDRLTVADASIIPNATSAFTHIPAVMLAERLSEQLTSAP